MRWPCFKQFQPARLQLISFKRTIKREEDMPQKQRNKKTSGFKGAANKSGGNGGTSESTAAQTAKKPVDMNKRCSDYLNAYC